MISFHGEKKKIPVVNIVMSVLRLLLMLFGPGSGDSREHPPKSQTNVV